MKDDERNRVIDEMVAVSQKLQPNGCCSAPEWRGHLRQYHQGYEDGIDILLTALEQLEAP